MKRLLTGLVLLTMMIVNLAPAVVAADRGSREQTLRYDAPWGMRWAHFWDDYVSYIPEAPPLEFFPRPQDRSVELLLDADDGRPVYAHFFQAGDSGAHLDRYYCGRRALIDLVSQEPVEVKVYVGACENHLIAYGLGGTITALFSPRRTPATSPKGHDH